MDIVTLLKNVYMPLKLICKHKNDYIRLKLIYKRLENWAAQFKFVAQNHILILRI